MAKPKKPPWIDRRKDNGVFYVFVDGNRHTSLGTTDAEKAQEEFRRWLNLNHSLESAGNTPTMRLILEVYHEQHVLATRENGAPYVQDRRRRQYIRDYGIEFFKDMLITDIDRAVIKQYCKLRRAGKIGSLRKVKDGTIELELNHFITACNFMVKYAEPMSIRLRPELIPPFGKLKPPKVKKEQRVVLQAEQRRMLRDAEKHRDLQGQVMDGRLLRLERFLWVAFETGARSRVIELLLWEQIDLTLGYIDFNPPGRPATNKRNPKVRISDELMPILERAYAERISDRFMDHTGSCKGTFKNFCEKWGYESMTRHTIRHSFITQKVIAGVDLVKIAATVGDNVNTIIKHYIHLSPRESDDVVNAGKIPLSDASDKPQSGRLLAG